MHQLFNPRCYLLVSIGLGALALSGCSTTTSPQSNLYYHAPAQAYNLFLGNSAIIGEPVLRESCSPQGSSLMIIDNTGNRYKVDTINLLGNPNFAQVDEAQTLLFAVQDYYRQLYQVPVNNSYTQAEVLPEQMVYTSVYLTEKGYQAQAPSEKLGMLIKRIDDRVLVLQHVQRYYQPDMVKHRLLTLYQNMQIPGQFAQKPLKDLEQDHPLGYMSVNPATATAEEIVSWRELAQCD